MTPDRTREVAAKMNRAVALLDALAEWDELTNDAERTKPKKGYARRYAELSLWDGGHDGGESSLHVTLDIETAQTILPEIRKLLCGQLKMLGIEPPEKSA